jgi:hypothetical protein
MPVARGDEDEFAEPEGREQQPVPGGLLPQERGRPHEGQGTQGVAGEVRAHARRRDEAALVAGEQRVAVVLERADPHDPARASPAPG